MRFCAGGWAGAAWCRGVGDGVKRCGRCGRCGAVWAEYGRVEWWGDLGRRGRCETLWGGVGRCEPV